MRLINRNNLDETVYTAVFVQANNFTGWPRKWNIFRSNTK